ncbi:MAG: hypothetical protein C0598_02930 [Marinilabiliales bacterium]|nr:MAG: hypothetical protein C0598_02930 [Marinilabiliales bacterium]
MEKNKIIIGLAIVAIIAVVGFMAADFFIGFDKPQKNVYEFKLDDFTDVDSSLINYTEVLNFNIDIEKMKAVDVDKDDNIYVAGKDKILIYDKNAKFIRQIYTEVEALSLKVSDNNDIYLGARDHVEIWNFEGEKEASWEVLNPRVVITSIALTDSSVFVADAGNKIIYHYNLNGKLKNEIGRKDSIKGIQGFVIPSPYFDIAIGRDNELWVVNSGRHQFEAYDMYGNLKSSWKKTSMNLDGFSGCCNPSNMAILPNGSFVTTEKGIVRIKIHKPSGEFESVVATPKQFDKGTRGLDVAVDSENRIILLDPMRAMIRIFEKDNK